MKKRFVSPVIMVLLAVTLLGCGAQPPPGHYYITDYGAIPNDGLPDTEAIQKAINTCAIKGGGIVVFPPGSFHSGALTLLPNTSWHMMSHSTLQASENIEDYPSGRFISGKGLIGVSITGHGVIDGAGDKFWDENHKPKARPEPWIELEDCKHLSISGIRFQNSPSHTLKVAKSEHINIQNISIVNPFEGPNTDGIDIVNSRNVTISDTYISTGDDAICLKSNRGIVENVTVTNCILESDDAAIKFGTGSRVSIRYCTFSNNIIKKSRYGIALFMLDGGVFEHNLFSGLIIENDSRHKYQYPIYIDIDKRVADRNYGDVRDNTFSNIQAVTNGKILISGHPESNVERLILRNITLDVQKPADFAKAKKPRGNKKYPKLDTSIDLSGKPGHVVIGYSRAVTIQNLGVHAPAGSTRQALYSENMVDSDHQDIKLTTYQP